MSRSHRYRRARRENLIGARSARADSPRTRTSTGASIRTGNGRSPHAVILGRRSYDEWSEFWPGSEIEPFATFINQVPKYVASSTPLQQPWNNATAIDGDLAQFVRGLKNAPGADIGVHASISVAQALLKADVVDEVRLTIAPAIAGAGRRLLEGLPPARLELIRSVTSPSGYLLADYRVAR